MLEKIPCYFYMESVILFKTLVFREMCISSAFFQTFLGQLSLIV